MKIALAILALALSGCASIMPASAKSVQDTRATVAELAQETAPGTSVAAKALQQAKEPVGIIPPSAVSAIEDHLIGIAGTATPLLGAILYQIRRARRREEELTRERENERCQRQREREKRLAELPPETARAELERDSVAV